MADNGVWFKLWCASDDDGDLDNLDICDYGRWCKFGTHTKRHGTTGKVKIVSPARTLCSKLQVANFDELEAAIRRFPHVSVTSKNVTNAIVTLVCEWENWQKYQVDNSSSRVRKYRQSVTDKKRREEMRGDEKRRDEIMQCSEGEKEDAQTTDLLLPDWLDKTAWNNYRDYRKKIRHPMTEHAERLAINKLRTLMEAGCNPTEVIEQSILNSWRGLFEIKSGKGHPDKQFSDRIKRVLMRGL